VAVERIEGVSEAVFSYPEGTGRVTYDTTRTSAAAIIEELRQATGYGAAVTQD
jgi:copper chaperone CopZ